MLKLYNVKLHRCHNCEDAYYYKRNLAWDVTCQPCINDIAISTYGGCSCNVPNAHPPCSFCTDSGYSTDYSDPIVDIFKKFNYNKL